MNPNSSVVEQGVVRARAQWQRLRLLRHSSIVGILSCFAVDAIGLAVLRGWMVHRSLVLTVLASVAGLALLFELLIVVSAISGVPKRRWLAAAVEKIDPRFQDRLNTLLFLEMRQGEPQAVAFTERIAAQARRVLDVRAPRLPFSNIPSLVWFGSFLSILGVCAWFSLWRVPWNQLQSGSSLQVQHQGNQRPPTVALLTTNVTQRPAWGEVRITEPGGDLQLTKVDVVPLAIEAAANQNLQQVAWYSSVNGKPEQAHSLPAPKDPKYALYHPTLYLDELELADWDVLTYYAKARTESSNHYASEVYFIEVRPFREDIVKMPGGEGGAAYQTISAISSLIGTQQRIIRGTHQYVQRAGEPGAGPIERDNLAQSELDLGDAAQHLYGEMAANMENQPIGRALDNLAKAEASLDDAGQSLKDDQLGPAQELERAALADLVATRKIFQQAVTDHSRDFSPAREENSPVANSTDKLNQMAEFRDETKSAGEYIQKLQEDQEQIEKRAEAGAEHGSSDLTLREREIERSLREFSAQHPRPFKNSQSESEQAQRALRHAGEALQAGNAEAPAATREANQGLQTLGAAMQRLSSVQQTTDAYRLRQVLQAQIRALDQLAKASPVDSAEQAAKAAQAARDVVNRLKSNLGQGSSSGPFGQPLHEGLNDQNKAELERKLSELQNAPSDSERQSRAGESRDALARLDLAFGAGEPKSLQQARNTDVLKPDPGSSLTTGLSQLDNLLRQLEQGRNVPAADQQKQARQALANLEAGLENQPGQNSRGEGLVGQLRDMLGNQPGLDPTNLRRLLDQLERFSAEIRATAAVHRDDLEVLNQDPLLLPQGYRDRIESYFRKLSEK